MSMKMKVKQWRIARWRAVSRAEEKERSRERDEAMLASGEKTRDQLRQENNRFYLPGMKPNYFGALEIAPGTRAEVEDEMTGANSDILGAVDTAGARFVCWEHVDRLPSAADRSACIADIDRDRQARARGDLVGGDPCWMAIWPDGSKEALQALDAVFRRGCIVCSKRLLKVDFDRRVKATERWLVPTADDWREALLDVAARLGGDTWPDDVTPDRLRSFCIARIEAQEKQEAERGLAKSTSAEEEQKRKPLTWRELRHCLSAMSDAQLDDAARWCGEEHAGEILGVNVLSEEHVDLGDGMEPLSVYGAIDERSVVARWPAGAVIMLVD